MLAWTCPSPSVYTTSSTSPVQLAPAFLCDIQPDEEVEFEGLRQGHEVTVRRLSARPLVYLVRGWLTHDECNHIADLAGAQEFSAAVTSGSDELSHTWRRRCEVMPLSPHADELLLEITRDASELAFGEEAWERRSDLQVEGEDLQVLRYSKGGEYKPHWDATWEQPRVATLLYYLNGVGSTWFPLASSVDASVAPQPPVSTADAYGRAARLSPERDGLRVQPAAAGDALLFYHMDDTSSLDLCSLHAGLPTPSTKLIASQFFTANGARPPEAAPGAVADV